MPDLVKLSIVFVIILILIRKNISVGIVLLIAGSIMMLFYQFDITKVFEVIKHTITDFNTIKLLLALSLIRCFELILRQNDIMTNMMNGIRMILRNKKLVIISMPVIIGLLPSLGGAYFSAPMVQETTKDTNISREEKAFINYWFRHIWECILPLYPGIMLVSVITIIDLQKILIFNAPLTLSMIFAGFYLSMRGVRGDVSYKEMHNEKSTSLVLAFLPISVLLFLVILLGFELYISLLILNLFLIVIYKIKPKEIFNIIYYGFAKDVFILIFGVMLFKQVLEMSGAINNISIFFNNEGIPLLPILLFLPFITGLLTGLTVAFVGSTFPLLIGISNSVDIKEITLAFASGYIGVLLSPVHLCLLLTRDYFFADLRGIYKKIIPASVFTALVSILFFILLESFV